MIDRKKKTFFIYDSIAGLGTLKLALTSMAYFPEYFDVIAVDEHHFQVYMSQRKYIRQGEELVLSPQAELLLWNTSDQPAHSFPKPDRVYTIDFEGAFHAIRQQGETYILSEQTGELFLVAEEQLRKIEDARLPSMAARSAKASSPLLVLDKDRDEFLFYHTEQQQFSAPLPSPQARSFSPEERSARHRAIENAMHAVMQERQAGSQ